MPVPVNRGEAGSAGRFSRTASDARAPYLPENLWGYGKRLRFVDAAIRRASPSRARYELKVLDVGCGNGSQFAIPMAEAGYHVTAIDPHRPSIERGRRLSRKVEFFHGSLGELPRRRFDCVIISEVLEHLDAPEALLRASLPHLSEDGLLIVTVPNGYGEFECDRRLYAALRLEKMVGHLRSVFGMGDSGQCFAGSDDRSPHVQRFTLSRLRQMFDRNGLTLIESRGTSLVSGPIVAHLFGKLKIFVQLNAAIADRVPLGIVAGWMFALRRAR
jgi:SAM-dependent methyltransferase